MPASMMSAATGFRLNVMGSSIAMVAMGPMPGSTPMSVPRITPMKQYRTLSGWTATVKPRTRLLKISICALRLLEHRRPDGEGQRQPYYEHQARTDESDPEQNRDFPPPEFMAPVGADESERRSRADEAKGLHQVA